MSPGQWLRDALLSALSASSSGPSLQSQIFLLQCSAAPRSDDDNPRPVPGFLSDRFVHIHAVLTAQAIRAFCQRHDRSNLGMLAQATIALKAYTVMLSEPVNGLFPRLLVVVDEFNFLAPLDTWPKTQLVDHDEQVAARFRYLHRDFFVLAPVPPAAGPVVAQIDPDAVRIIVANSAKSATVPGWSEITRSPPDPDDDSLRSDPPPAAAADRTAAMTASQSPTRSKAAGGLQLLSPEKIVVLDPRSDEGQHHHHHHPHQAKPSEEQRDDDDTTIRVPDAGPGRTGPGPTTAVPIPPDVVAVEYMDLCSATGDMTMSLTQQMMMMANGADSNLIELTTYIDLVNDDDDSDDPDGDDAADLASSVKIAVKQEIVSPPPPAQRRPPAPGRAGPMTSTPPSGHPVAVDVDPLVLGDDAEPPPGPLEDAAVSGPSKRLRTNNVDDAIERRPAQGLSSHDLLLHVLKDAVSRCRRRRS